MEYLSHKINIKPLKFAVLNHEVTKGMCDNFNCTPSEFMDLASLDGKDYKFGMQYEKLSNQLNKAFTALNVNYSVTHVMYNDEDIIGYYTANVWVAKVSDAYRDSNDLNEASNVGYPCVDVSYLAVDNNYQRQGYGQLLLKQLLLNVYIRLVPFVGTNLITLDALKRNGPLKFYQDFGFMPYAQGKTQKILTPLALNTISIPQALKIGEKGETVEEQHIRHMLEASILDLM